MKFENLLAVAGEEPVFETSLLLAGDVDPADVQRQLSRWALAGRISKLRKGLYALNPPFRRAAPHPFLVANALVRPSYVSFESALAHHGLIPEHVPVTTSATTGRTGRHGTALGTFVFHHIQHHRLWGYVSLDLGGQRAFVALPEKALLDLVHLRPGADAPAFLHELRLQNLDRLDRERLQGFADRFGSPKIRRAAGTLLEMATEEEEEYDSL